MRVVFVQTYPVYHDGLSTGQWLELENRDKWMPGVAASMGHDVELWAAGDDDVQQSSRLEGLGEYLIRIFKTDRTKRPTKFHASDALVENALRKPAELYVLKGVDGGVGEQLLDQHIIPQGRLFAFVIGGKFYTRRVPLAAAVLYETEAQRDELARASRPWRRRIKGDRLIRLPKSVDTDVFTPSQDAEVEWDVISVGRIDERLKKFDIIGDLSNRHRVAVVGDGPSLDALRSRFPSAAWLGRQANSELPRFLQRARMFLFEGGRDYFPRVLVEAAACGLPVVASDSIAEDVLPGSIGLRRPSGKLMSAVEELLADEPRREELARAARARAVENWGKYSSEEALRAMFELVGDSESSGRFAQGRRSA